MKRNVHCSKYFCGNEISRYGLENGYLDYRTLAKAFDAVLVNDITKLFYADVNGEYSEAELVNGWIDNSEQIDAKKEQDETPDIYQYYIVSNGGADILQKYTNDPVYYLPVLDCYIWGVTHYGTSWDYVLTDVKLEV